MQTVCIGLLVSRLNIALSDVKCNYDFSLISLISRLKIRVKSFFFLY